MKLRKLLCIICILSCVIITCSLACFATEIEERAITEPYYSPQVTFNMPGYNGSMNTKVDCSSEVGVLKINNEDRVGTFYTVLCGAQLGTDGRIINMYQVSRSAWARDLTTGSTRTANLDKVAEDGYLYFAEISSDLLETSSYTFSFMFSPDNMT